MKLIEELLEEAGFVKDRTYKEIRFLKVPDENFAVWFESKQASGSDLEIRLINHFYRIEIYSQKAEMPEQNALEKALNSCGIEWEAEEKNWIYDLQKFMVAYNFDYMEKI